MFSHHYNWEAKQWRAYELKRGQITVKRVPRYSKIMLARRSTPLPWHGELHGRVLIQKFSPAETQSRTVGPPQHNRIRLHQIVTKETIRMEREAWGTERIQSA